MSNVYGKCPNCGAEAEADSLFCGECGYKFEVQQDVTQSNEKQICPICGAAVEIDSLFCGKCGYSLENMRKKEFIKNTAKEVYNSVEKTIKSVADTAQESAAKIKENYQNRAQASSEREYADASETAAQVRVKGTNNFVDSDEYVVKTLGNGYLQNVVTVGKASNTTAILTQKRLYFSGTAFERHGFSLKKIKVSKIIDLEDITGTGFVYISNIKFIIIAFLLMAVGTTLSIGFDEISYFIVSVILAAINFCIWLFKKITLFRIEYAGGEIGFDVKWLNISVVSVFQKQIYRMKAKKKYD